MDPQTHLIYLLLDSNLPTGGFVASSGLESWAKHGLGGPYSAYTSTSAAPVSGTSHGAGQAGSQPSRAGGQVHASKRVTEFMEAEVDNYAASTGWFVRQGWRVVEGLINRQSGSRGRCASCGGRSRRRGESTGPEVRSTPDDIEQTLQSILALDKTHEATLLSHVSRRASKAQGVAILTLYTKGLTRPPGYATSTGDIASDTNEEDKETSEEREGREEIAGAVVEGYKRLIRRGLAPGHLAVCWGLMMAALGLSLGRSSFLSSLPSLIFSLPRAERSSLVMVRQKLTSRKRVSPLSVPTRPFRPLSRGPPEPHWAIPLLPALTSPDEWDTRAA